MAVSSIARNVPVMDSNQRVRVNAEAITTVSSVTTLTTCATVNTVGNVVQFGGQNISHLPTAITNAAFLQLRSNITVT
jgi:carbon monoxide dehydrogenase subunit G